MRLHRPFGVRVHLVGAAVALAIVSVAVTGVFAQHAVDRELGAFAKRDLQQAAARVAAHAAFGYRREGGWTRAWVVQLADVERSENRALVVEDATGRVLRGSAPAVPPNSEAADVVVGGRTVGRVVSGRRTGAGDGLNTQLKSRLGERLVEAGVLAGVLALMLALIVALRMARPLHRLTDVARRMAHGEIETRAVGSGGPRETTELARTLDRLAAALRRQDELRRATVADIVHELRNTLVGVVGRIEALQDGMVADEQTALERTARDARRLNRLVDVASERGSAFADRFADRGIVFTCSTAPARVEGDSERLAQIVDNLLSNALRYTDPGGTVSLRLSVRQGEAVLQVIDSGIGIAPEYLGRIFDRFWRDPTARVRVAEGSGVGLALVRDLALSHDGRVEVESRPGKGSTFSVYLPIAAEAVPEGPLVLEPTPESTEAADGPMVWRLRGEIDTANAARIEAELLEAVCRGAGDVVLDLTDVAFIDSSGLGSLVAVAAEVRTRGGHLAIVPGPPHVRRVFDLLQLDELLEVVDTRNDALASFAPN